MQGAHSTAQMADSFELAGSTIRKLLRPLQQHYMVKKQGRLFYANSSHPLVKALTRLVFIANTQRDILELATDISSLRIFRSIWQNNGITYNTIMQDTQLSRATTYRGVRLLLDKNLIVKKTSRPCKFYINSKNEAVNQLLAFSLELSNKLQDFNTGIHRLPVIKQVQNDDRVLLALLYGSSIRKNGYDNKSDLDLLIVANEPRDVDELKSAYSGENIDLSVFSKTGFLHLLRQQPAFAKTIMGGKALKGGDFLDICRQTCK